MRKTLLKLMFCALMLPEMAQASDNYPSSTIVNVGDDVYMAYFFSSSFGNDVTGGSDLIALGKNDVLQVTGGNTNSLMFYGELQTHVTKLDILDEKQDTVYSAYFLFQGDSVQTDVRKTGLMLSKPYNWVWYTTDKVEIKGDSVYGYFNNKTSDPYFNGIDTVVAISEPYDDTLVLNCIYKEGDTMPYPDNDLVGIYRDFWYYSKYNGETNYNEKYMVHLEAGVSPMYINTANLKYRKQDSRFYIEGPDGIDIAPDDYTFIVNNYSSNTLKEIFGDLTTVTLKAFTDLTSGVKMVQADEELLNGKVYDLQGREVNNLEAGHVYIQNGKKFMIQK